MKTEKESCSQNGTCARATVAANLKTLMRLKTPRWTQRELANKAGVSQRTVTNLLAGPCKQTNGATVDIIEAVATVFGLRGWHLLMPGLPADTDQAQTITKVVQAYIRTDNSGKDLMRRLAERL